MLIPCREDPMRTHFLIFVASALFMGCGSSNGGSSGGIPATGGSTAIVSCEWGTGTCDQYSGTIDPFFATSLQTTCNDHGVAFATTTCPAANQVGHCDLGTSSGMANSYFYYAPTYDAATAQADCQGHGVGATWVP